MILNEGKNSVGRQERGPCTLRAADVPGLKCVTNRHAAGRKVAGTVADTVYTPAMAPIRGGRPDPRTSMIAQLTGRVDAIADGTCIIDVGGVGYLVQASSRTLSALPQPPAAAKLLVETHVREDAIILYGFANSVERDWFRLLTTVQGVGGKVALGILSALAPRDLIGAIAAGDKASLNSRAGRRSPSRRPLADRAEGQDRRHADLRDRGRLYPGPPHRHGGGRAVRPGQPGLPPARGSASSDQGHGTPGRRRHPGCADP